MKKFVNTDANWKDAEGWKEALDRFESKVQQVLIINEKLSIVEIVEDLQKFLDINIYSKFISLQHLEVNMKKIMGYLERINADHQLDDHILIILNLLFDCATHFQKGHDSLAILILAHESLDLICKVDNNLEKKLAKAIGEHYSALKEYRLAAYYLGYVVQQSGDDKEEVMALLLNQPLFKLADILCETLLLEFQCLSIIEDFQPTWSQGKLDEIGCFLEEIYVNLLRLGDYFYSIGERGRAKRCYERCSALVKAYIIPNVRLGLNKNPFGGISYIDISEARCAKLRDKQDITPISTHYQEYTKSLKAHRRVLTETRESAKLQLDSENIMTVQKKLTDNIKEILQNCFQLTCRSLGDLHLQGMDFSLLLFGSLARNEACLGSDVEFAIVYHHWFFSFGYEPPHPERTRLYFQSLINLFELNIIALGETGELCLSQKTVSLERLRKGIKRGLQFDDGGHYPFSKKEYAMLCADVTGGGNLIERQKLSNKLFEIRKVMPYQSVKSIADYLGREIVVLYGLCEATSLFNDDNRSNRSYFKNLQEDFNIPIELLNYKQLLGLWVFNSPFLEVSKVKTILNIKEDLLRIPQWVVRSFSLFYSAPMGHGIERLQWLGQNKFIHANLGLLLEIIIEYLFVCRNRAHQFYQKENDTLYLQSAEEHEFSRLIFPEVVCIPMILAEIYPFFIDIIKTWQTEVVSGKQDAVLLSVKVGERSAGFIFQLLEKLVTERIFTGLTISLLTKVIGSDFKKQLMSKLNLEKTMDALLKQADKYKYLGNLLLAKRTYELALLISPGQEASLLSIGDIYLILNQLDPAREIYSRILDVRGKARIGVVLFLSMRFNESKQTFEEILKYDSTHNLGLLGKAMCCLQSDLSDEALKLFLCLDKMLDKKSLDFVKADMLIFKIKMYTVLFRIKEAERVYQDLIKINLNQEHIKIDILKPSFIFGRHLELGEDEDKKIILIDREREQVVYMSNIAKRMDELVEGLTRKGNFSEISKEAFKKLLSNIFESSNESTMKMAMELLLDNKIREAEILFEEEYAKNSWNFIAAEGSEICKIKRNIVQVNRLFSLFSVTQKILENQPIEYKSICAIRSMLLNFLQELSLSEFYLSVPVKYDSVVVIPDSPVHRFFYRHPRVLNEFDLRRETIKNYGSINEAIDFFNQPFSGEFMIRGAFLKENPKFLLMSAEKLFDAKRYHRAIVCYNEVISFYNDSRILSSDQNILLAMALYGKGRALLLSFKVYSKQVIELFTKAFILEPRYFFACQAVAFYLNANQPDRLQNILSQIDDILTNSDESQFIKCRVYHERGDLYCAIANYELAKLAYLRARQLNSEDYSVEKKLIRLNTKIPIPVPVTIRPSYSRRKSRGYYDSLSSKHAKEFPLLFITEPLENDQSSPKAKYLVVEQMQLEKVDKKKLGKGSYGKVYRGICTHPSLEGKEVAIKQFKKSSISLDLVKFKAEAEFQATLDSPYIVKLLAITETIPYCIVMELMDRNLFDFLSKTKIEDVTWECRYQIAYDICSALEYLHTRNKIHSDLKSPNILLTKDRKAKLSDFGLACIRPSLSSQYTFGAGANGPRGTVLWTAPELFDETQKRSTKSDIYSFGVVLWELAVHQRPYPEEISDLKVIDRIKRGDIEPFSQNTPDNFRELATQCMSLDKHSRPEAGMVLRQLKFMMFAPKQDHTQKDASGPQSKFGF